MIGKYPCQNLFGGTGEAIYHNVDGMCDHPECNPETITETKERVKQRSKDLRALAEWRGTIPVNLLINNGWNPFLDSNQLDMLEDKMIEEAKISKIVLSFFHETKNGEWLIEYWCLSMEKRITAGQGKTKNEARLNAILNYIENK